MSNHALAPAFTLEDARGEDRYHSRSVNGADLQEATSVVARYRQVELEPLEPLLSQMPALAQRKWEAWRRKQRLEQSSPANFADLLGTCFAFTEPLFTTKLDRMQWFPQSQTWERAPGDVDG